MWSDIMLAAAILVGVAFCIAGGWATYDMWRRMRREQCEFSRLQKELEARFHALGGRGTNKGE